MNRMKALYQRFRAWQKEPIHYAEAYEKHTCANCRHEYAGDYCPVCGQKHNVGRIGWKSTWVDLSKVWGKESYSMLNSLLQLLGRPGFLINDYIHGRRQVCYSPLSMLFLVAIAVLMIERLTGNNYLENLSVSLNDGEYKMTEEIIRWFGANMAWGVLAITVFAILPTWLLFRYAPRNTRHTIPDGIYIQMFMSTIMLLAVFLTDLLSEWFIWLIPLYYFIAYYQLFGYGVWATLWRTALCLYEVAFLGMSLILMTLYIVGDISKRHSVAEYIAATSVLVAINLGFLFIGLLIGKQSYKRREKA